MKRNTPDSLSARWKPAKPMTSAPWFTPPGTCGTAPKGAVHTYRTMRAGADHSLQLDPWFEKDNVVPFLPPAWMHGTMVRHRLSSAVGLHPEFR